MIRIDGLTSSQRDLLDEMWTKDTSEELYNWMESLTPACAMEVEVLVELVKLAYIDKEVTCTTDLSLAEEFIEKARKSVDK